MSFPSFRDSLLIVALAGCTYLVLIALAQLLRRWRDVKFGPTYHAFAMAAGLLAGVHYVGRDGVDAVAPWRVASLQHLTAATIVLALFPVVALLNRSLWAKARAGRPGGDTPRLLADATGMVVALVGVLAVLQYIYDVAVPGLLAGSGVAALVLGLAMQDLLANILAGFALLVEKPFKTGDWLLIDGHEARVVEINWRSTRLLTDDDVFLDVPNSHLVKQSIINFHQPDSRHALRTRIGLHYDAAPERVKELLGAAAASVPGVCVQPPPSVVLLEFGDSAIVYEVEVWVDDHGLQKTILSGVRSHCWYALKRAGIDIPYPQLVLHRAAPAVSHEAARSAAVHALRAHKILGVLEIAALEQLVAASRVQLFASTEHIITQDAAGGSMFFLVRGGVEVRITRDGKTDTVAKLGAGDCFGEMSLLTGETRNATVVASGEVEAVEIAKADFAALIRAQPALLEKLTELLTQRQLANKQHADAAAGPPVEQVRAGVLKKLRAFFELG